MKLATKLGTGAAVTLVGAGVALGVALTGSSHGTTQTPVVVQRVADTSAGPSASLSASRSGSTVVKPAAQNAAPIQKVAPVVPNDQPAPTDTAAPTETVAPAAEQGVVGPDNQMRPALPTGPIGGRTSEPPPDKPVLSGIDPAPSPSAS